MSAEIERDPFVPRRYRVECVRPELADTVTLDLVPLDHAVPTFEPGQFNMLYAFGVGEAAISLSGDPCDRSRLVHTVRAVGAVSTAIARLTSGAVLGVRGPFGSAWPLASSRQRDLLVVAGGLGLAPLRPAIYHLLAQRKRYRRVIVLVGMRRPAEILFRDEIERWRGERDIELEITVDHHDADWHGHVGVVPSLIPGIGLDAASTLALVCGPEIMMRFTINALVDAGVPPNAIHLSMERNMKCAIGLCGHCQFGSTFVCKDGPVMRLDRIAPLLACREI